jgi:hypothetical protein
MAGADKKIAENFFRLEYDIYEDGEIVGSGETTVISNNPKERGDYVKTNIGERLKMEYPGRNLTLTIKQFTPVSQDEFNMVMTREHVREKKG